MTTRALLREVAMLRELMESRINSQKEVVETRLTAMDKAVVLLQTSTELQRTVILSQVEQLKDLHGEKFQGVQRQFTERDERTKSTAELNQKAIDAALQAAKELVGVQAKSNEQTNAKTESMLVKQVEGIIDLIKTNALSTSDKIEANAKSANDRNDGMKERIAMMESRQSAYESRGKGAGDMWGVIIGVIGVVAAVAIVVATVMHK
jgi:hypothetical protein